MANYFNSTFSIKPGAKGLQRSSQPMKQGGKLRPIRKTEPGSIARLKQDLTKVLSKYVRLRDPLCIVCGRNESDQAGHLFHRDMPSVEFDPRNVWGICGPCNFRHETVPQPMHNAVLMRLGERSYADLCELAHNHKMKLSPIELDLLFSELTEKVKNQTARSPREIE